LNQGWLIQQPTIWKTGKYRSVIWRLIAGFAARGSLGFHLFLSKAKGAGDFSVRWLLRRGLWNFCSSSEIFRVALGVFRLGARHGYCCFGWSTGCWIGGFVVSVVSPERSTSISVVVFIVHRTNLLLMPLPALLLLAFRNLLLVWLQILLVILLLLLAVFPLLS
jgi:hypothetical protein